MADAMKADWWRGRAIKLAGVVAHAVAVLGIRLAFEIGEGTWYGRLLEEVAFALLIAALLGLSIDYLLKHDLVEDSFKAAIGYLLPDELRPEMAWINGLTLLATSYRADYELRRLPNDAAHVVVRERIERHVKNITKSRQPVEPGTGTGEWFYPTRRSRVTSWSCTIGGQTWTLGRDAEVVTTKSPTNATIGVSIPKQVLNAGEECVTVAELEEIRTTSDQTYDFFDSATAQATISVQADDGLAFNVAPQHREAARDLGNGVFELKQTLLPGQVIRVRWWEKTDMDLWLAENAKK